MSNSGRSTLASILGPCCCPRLPLEIRHCVPAAITERYNVVLDVARTSTRVLSGTWARVAALKGFGDRAIAMRAAVERYRQEQEHDEKAVHFSD